MVCVLQHLWQMLVQDADLLSHLRIIKDFYLLGRGELYLAFIDQSQHLLRVPATANTEHGKTFCFLFVLHWYHMCICHQLDHSSR